MRALSILLTVSLLATSTATAQLFQLRTVTSAYSWQRQDTVGQSSNHLFGYQTLQFSLAGKKVSFHTYIQGFNDFSGPRKNEGQYRLYNLYLRLSDLFDLLDLKAGRVPIFAGAGNSIIDGGSATLKFFDSRVKFIGYYGTLTPPRLKAEMIGDRKNNFMTGSQLIISPIDEATFSASYMRKNIKPETYTAIRRDSLFNPYLVEINPSSTAEEYLSGDLNFSNGNALDAYARYDYDVNLDRTSRVQFFTRVKVMEPLNLTGEYVYREPRISYNSIFWVFAYNTLNEYEVGLEYAVTQQCQVFGKYGYVSYGDEDSRRVTAGANSQYLSVSLTHNVGYDGKISAASANVGYPLWNRKLTPTIAVSYAQYKLSGGSASLDNALSASCGAVYRPSQNHLMDLQIQWIQNRIYQNDVRIFFRMSFLVNQQLGIF